MTILAHISDIHLSPLPEVHFSQLLNKRLTGYVNWKLRRKGAMTSDSLERLLMHLRQKKPDFIAVTGDLVNLALPAEIDVASKWLEWLAPPQQACISPGNHDAYVSGSLGQALEAYGPYMSGESLDSAPFPFVRRVNEIAVISCSSAVATPPFISAGHFDAAQAQRLTKILRLMKSAGYFRVIMIHHPPNKDAEVAASAQLLGAKRFRNVIAEEGAELILHGHTHASSMSAIDGPQKPVPVIGVAAASTSIGSKHPPARYNLFQISQVNDSWSCTMREFGFQRIGDDIVQRLQIRIY